MALNRFHWTMWWALLTTVSFATCAAAQAPRTTRILPPPVATKPADPVVDDQGLSCVIYGLADLGDDPNLGAWIAKTMTGVIQPASWSEVGGSGVISYYGPAKMLVVYQTPAVHVQIDAFLKNVKKSLPPVKAPMTMPTAMTAQNRDVVPAHHVVVPEPSRAAAAAPAAKSTYPIPAPLQQPKHLFHFIIRYEGDGVVDANLSTLAKALVGDTSVGEEKSDQTKSDPAKSLSQLFNIILRYEGEGIIDSNVAEVIKAIHAMQSSQHSDPAVLPRAPVTSLDAPTATVQNLPPATSSAPNSLPVLNPSFSPYASVPTAPGLPHPLPHPLPQALPQPVSGPRLIMPPADSPTSTAPPGSAPANSAPANSAPASAPATLR